MTMLGSLGLSCAIAPCKIMLQCAPAAFVALVYGPVLTMPQGGVHRQLNTCRQTGTQTCDGQTDRLHRQAYRETGKGQTDGWIHTDRHAGRQPLSESSCGKLGRRLPSCRAHLHEAGRLGQLRGPVGDK